MKRIEPKSLTNDDLLEIAKIIKNPLLHNIDSTEIRYKNQKWKPECLTIDNADSNNEIWAKYWSFGRLVLGSHLPVCAIIYKPNGEIYTWATEGKRSIIEHILNTDNYNFTDSDHTKNITTKIKNNT